MDKLLEAIVDDDRKTVQALLQKDGELAARLITRQKLFHSKIFHWIYVGDTALHLAAAGYRVELIRLLLRSGADANAAKNRRSSTPLHYASDGCLTCPAWDPTKQVETIRTLLKVGGDVHAQDANGATALHRAVRTRCAAAVECLLNSGADATQMNKPGSTPFHLAVQNTGRGGSGAAVAIAAQREIILQFLRHGLTPDLKSAGGKTVRESARSEWITELLDGKEGCP